MRCNSIVIALTLAGTALVTIPTGSCAEEPAIDAGTQQRTLSVSGANDGNVSHRRTFETFIDLVGIEGYVGEEHNVKTDDDYFLTLHRISGGPKSPPAHGKQPILLIHGLLAASDIWVLRGSKYDLAYMLVDNGYDVWALNTRGNYYSKRHKYMSPEQPKFWRFSWDEFGYYDASATIDYILSLTKKPKISLVGHSMGSTVQFVLLSRRPEYNDKVNIAVALGPVAIFTHAVPGVIPEIGIRFKNQIMNLLRLVPPFEVLPRDGIDLAYYVSICLRPSFRPICAKILNYMTGVANLEELDFSLLPRAWRHYPQGTSVEAVMHYAQIAASGNFTQYDFGPLSNHLRYKSFKPPEYPLARITAPIILYYSLNDAYSTKQDAEALLKKIPSASSREVPYANFGHLDFILFNGARRLLYNDVIEILNDYRHTKSNGIEDNRVA